MVNKTERVKNNSKQRSKSKHFDDGTQRCREFCTV